MSRIQRTVLVSLVILLALLLVTLAFADKKCPKCGVVNPDVAKFCKDCGEKFPVKKAKAKPKKERINADVSVDADSIMVTSVPEGAAVYLNGVYKANTPVTLNNLSAGPYEVKLTYPRYVSYSETAWVLGSEAPAEESKEPLANAASTDTTAQKSDPRDVVAVISMAKGGDIVIEFYPADAPKTVDNFIKLTNRGFYNGLTFHRVVPGFVVQGSDPLGNGTGDAGYEILAEFNEQKHVTGTVGMARGRDPNSASCQFYICLSPQPLLDGKYTVFGQVIGGMDVVKDIEPGDVMKSVRILEKSAT